jgi:hypothetical protein
MVKQVKFNDEITIFSHPEELETLLQEYRRAGMYDLLRRQADKLRFENLLRPILQKKLETISKKDDAYLLEIELP